MDRFKFKSDKDQKLVCEVMAVRFGSALDTLLVLADASGNVLQQNDDTAGADARIEFDAKRDTEHMLVMRDLTAEARTLRIGYSGRLRRQQNQDSRRALPDAPRVHRGGQREGAMRGDPAGGIRGPGAICL